MLSKLRDYFALFKVYVQRSYSYITVLTMIMTLYLSISKFKESHPNLDLRILFIVSVVLVFVGIIIVGYLDQRWGVYKEEMRKLTGQNPQIMETLECVKRIEAKLNGK